MIQPGVADNSDPDRAMCVSRPIAQPSGHGLQNSPGRGPQCTPPELDGALVVVLKQAPHLADKSAVSVVASVTTVEWVFGAAGGLGVACLAWIIGGAVLASVRATASGRRDMLLLDELFDGGQERVTYRPGAGRSVDSTPAVIIAGATNRGYRFVEATHDDGLTSWSFSAFTRQPDNNLTRQ